MDVVRWCAEALERLAGWIVSSGWLLPGEFRLLGWIASTTGVVIIAVAVLEAMFPFRRHSFDRSHVTTLAYVVFGAKIGVFALVVNPGVRALYRHFELPSLDLDSRLPFAIYSLTAFLAMSFVDYWAHRWLHRIRWLWHIHRIHHAPEHLHFAIRYHAHFGMAILHAPLWAVTSSMLGVELAAPFGSLTILVDYFAHANIRLRLGWLNYVIVTPEVHRYHHSRNPRFYNTNYSNSFPLWDMVFGTFYYDPRDPATTFGVDDPVPSGFLAQQVQPLRLIGADVRGWWQRHRAARTETQTSGGG